MSALEKSMEVLSELFGKDVTFVLATASDNVVSARVVDAYYNNGVFWIVTYAKSNKVKDIESNPNIALCNNFHTFKGKACNAGHPLKEDNKAIREKLIRVFEPWYFAHNDENDEHMCYVKIVPESGVFHKDGTGYRVDFIGKTAEEFPFAPTIEMTALKSGR